MAEHSGEALARRLIPMADGSRIVALDSATFVESFYEGRRPVRADVIVNASYSGVFCAKLVMAYHPRAAIGLDCAIGKDGAGISGLWYYEALGIPAAAADVMTAEMGNGLDLHDHGIISRVNSLAEDAGVRPGMEVSAAAMLIGRPVAPVEGVRTNRVVIKTNAAGRSIVCTDSIPYALPEDIGRNVLCVGGHTGVSIIGYLKHFRPWGYLMSDGGMGKNKSGVAATDTLNAEGLPGASVSAMSARMGDGRSTYFDGVISACNALAQAKGVRVGQTAIEAADHLLKD
ncbi:MAG: hypothetical protein ABL904_10610 [Hyphomicrobiaceae bacterium]